MSLETYVSARLGSDDSEILVVRGSTMFAFLPVSPDLDQECGRVLRTSFSCYHDMLNDFHRLLSPQQMIETYRYPENVVPFVHEAVFLDRLSLLNVQMMRNEASSMRHLNLEHLVFTVSLSAQEFKLSKIWQLEQPLE